MNDPPSAQKCWAFVFPRNVLKNLRLILLAADTTIPSTYVEMVNERDIALCNTLGTVPLIGMSYPLLAVLKLIDLLRYSHMNYDAEFSQLRPPRQGADGNNHGVLSLPILLPR